MKVDRRLKVAVLGVRGIPNVQGGIETHAQHLYPRLAELGCDVEVIVRTPFVPRDVDRFGAVRITRIWSPVSSGLEAFVHSILGVLYAAIVRPDILHIHGIGPAIVTPIARLFGLRVVVTHHGPDYDRDKWGRFARSVLRIGERFGVCCSHARIAISGVIANLIKVKYGATSDRIPNGVVAVPVVRDSEHLSRFGLEPGKYFLQVSRIVPEKRQLDLIDAYQRIRQQVPDWKLALVGGNTDDTYGREVTTAASNAGVILTGFLNGIPLQQLYSHAGVFVLPSSHEGLPIALLEAMNYGLPVLASDIPAHLEIGLESDSYFPVGNSEALARSIARVAQEPVDTAARQRLVAWVTSTYDWDRVAAQTLEVYRRVCPFR